MNADSSGFTKMIDFAANKDDGNDDDADDVSSNGENNADGNLMKLGACGITSYWYLPNNLNRCPVNNCWMVLENNSALQRHYRKEHAKVIIIQNDRKKYNISFTRKYNGFSILFCVLHAVGL